MALLTTEDVLNKKFTPTKFREGYDQDEVDDFLDEVVETMGTLQSDNADLKAKLDAAEQRIVMSQSDSDYAPAPVAAEDHSEELEALRARVAELEGQLAASASASQDQGGEVEHFRQQMEQARQEAEQARYEVEQARSQAEQARQEAEQARVALEQAQQAQQAAPEAAAAVPEAGGAESATSLLAMAQRLHDQYIEDGEAESKRIIDEAHAKGEQILREAEEEHQRAVARYDQERALLEQKVNELKEFENDYRGQLRSHLEGLLRDVETAASN